jgi:hypothetical protein
MRQAHGIYPNQETKLPNRISSRPHCSIHLDRTNTVVRLSLDDSLLNELTGNNIDDTVWNTQLLVEFFGIADHLLEYFPRYIVMGRSDAELFDLNRSEVENERSRL